MTAPQQVDAGDEFSDVIRRIRSGDARAAAEFVRQYEPLIRREVRLHLGDARLSRLFDSTDVCQSVLASFFLRTAAGQYDLRSPGQLVRLLATMVRNKLASAQRRHFRQRRDVRHDQPLDSDLLDHIADPHQLPAEAIEQQDLLARFRECLSHEERQIARRRVEGATWGEIAAEMGGTAKSRRLQFSRAVDRVLGDLSIDE